MNKTIPAADTPMPRPLLFELPWKTDRLLHAPSAELEKWHLNMEKGMTLWENQIKYRYTIGALVQEFHSTPSQLILPNGSIKTFKPTVEDPKQTGLFPAEDTQLIKNVLINRLGDRTHLLGENTTLNALIDELVGKQSRKIRELGLERAGYFTEEFGSLRHHSFGQSITVDTPLDKWLEDKGERRPIVFMHVSQTDRQDHTPYIGYHTHPGPQNTTPSPGDLQIMESEGQNSIVIATRQQEGEYLITEWKKKNPTQPTINKSGNQTNMLAYLVDGTLRQILAHQFTTKQYHLKHQNGKTTLKPAK